MRIAIIGKGLIGGSFEKAAKRAGHEAAIFDKGEDFRVEDADVVFVAVPPAAVVVVIDAIAPRLKEGAIVVDATGVKTPVCDALRKYAFETRWVFVGGHPMAGKEKNGYENSDAALFDGASMILTPYPTYGRAPLDKLEKLLKEFGFARIVYTDPKHHDEMIAFTSQLCHVIATAYSRDGLKTYSDGFSAGSFADMTRIATQDEKIWSDLFLSDRDKLLPVLDRFISRLCEFRDALDRSDGGAIREIIRSGKKCGRHE